MGKKSKFFVVWNGKEPGIYHSWEGCKKQIHGYDGAIYKGFGTLEEAREAMLSPYWNYIGKKSKEPVLATNNKRTSSFISESISVDAACSGNPGLMEYRGVITSTKEQIFHQGPFQEGTNNIGEFLALVHGLALLKQKNSPLPLYTDSVTAMAWVRAKKAKTSLERTQKNDQLFDLISRAENWLKTNNYSTQILKWDTVNWGEIPADFGRK